jgi:sporulation-control protein spo0M
MPVQSKNARLSKPLRTKSLIRELTDTGKQLNATNADFLRIDAETALTFSQLAMETGNFEKRKRNCKNARKAYDGILRMWNSVTFTPTQEGYMHELLSRLKNNLELLGEKF